MIVNGASLLALSPIEDMIAEKRREFGVSWGLSEAGYDVRVKQELTLAPGEFTLASTVERFTMPTVLMGLVKDKSTHARRGLSLLNTTIEPGWAGWLTLEVKNIGNEVIHIPAGCGISQILFLRVSDPVAYEGKYQNQPDEPVPARSA